MPTSMSTSKTWFKIIAPLTQQLQIQIKSTDKTDQSVHTSFKLTFTNLPPKIISAMPAFTINAQEQF